MIPDSLTLQACGVHEHGVQCHIRDVSLAQVSCILMYVYVPPPTPVGAWSMALGLWQHIECSSCFNKQTDTIYDKE